MKCLCCGAENPRQARFCAYCGSELPIPAEPGSTVQPPQNASYHTTNHYYQVNNYYQAPTPNPVRYAPVPRRRKSRLVALLLCIFLGPIGAHKFYQGKILMGLIYLFTGGLFGVGYVVDIIVLAVSLLAKGTVILPPMSAMDTQGPMY